MTRLSAVERVQVPWSVALEAHGYLQAVGKQGLEAIALWVGGIEGQAASVAASYIPAQRGVRSAQGLAVVVDGDELHRLNLWLYHRELSLIAQLHSHPGEAYHSDTDDAFPIATRIGSLSIVVPDFAQAPFEVARCAVYRLRANGVWGALSSAEAAQLVSIEE